MGAIAADKQQLIRTRIRYPTYLNVLLFVGTMSSCLGVCLCCYTLVYTVHPAIWIAGLASFMSGVLVAVLTLRPNRHDDVPPEDCRSVLDAAEHLAVRGRLWHRLLLRGGYQRSRLQAHHLCGSQAPGVAPDGARERECLPPGLRSRREVKRRKVLVKMLHQDRGCVPRLCLVYVPAKARLPWCGFVVTTLEVTC
uniref:Uncharacterized protein n=1 Tax=Ixodes ricinus TaxID=34613 RepID=V5H0J3_IXORI